MPISHYLRDLRASVGSRLLLMPGVAAVIRNQEGHVLLQKRSDNGMWDIPAGSIDPGEAPAQAVIREVYEEAGLLVRPTAILGILGGKAFRVQYPNGDQVEYTATVFACEVIGGQLEAIDGESTEFRYTPPDDLPRMFSAYPKDIFVVEGAAGGPVAPTPYYEWREEWLDALQATRDGQ
ncbi:NUDIX domain-containing protein [Alicyclobacillus dauci]|uniref:NUDIX domain-containing protein n=1 Tax=Alicyclobacillus dauci TaxID=1475485 RepID=A0ABY6Z7I8_9BACL|nr:NUDIX domain-containing protein [Alicyclobacillus dauci]WAH38493.1 NUDIX domain-containing protein [Alicyclobacillus dauci]